jgi:hypothetical protein
MEKTMDNNLSDIANELRAEMKYSGVALQVWYVLTLIAAIACAVILMVKIVSLPYLGNIAIAACLYGLGGTAARRAHKTPSEETSAARAKRTIYFALAPLFFTLGALLAFSIKL